MTRHRPHRAEHLAAHRAERRRLLGPVPAAVLTAALVGTVLSLPFCWPSGHDPRPPTALVGPLPTGSPPVRPVRAVRPKYLTRSYRAPPALVRRSAGGRLRIPSLGVDAPVDAVKLDGSAMAVPDDPSRVGWLSSTARDADPLGSSVLAGHVSDEHDRPGALFGLHRIGRRALILWQDASGRVRRYRVLRVDVFRRNAGLPADLFETEGPHRLALVTCAERVSTAGGGFHYRSNLVVIAAEVTHRTRRGSTG